MQVELQRLAAARRRGASPNSEEAGGAGLAHLHDARAGLVLPSPATHAILTVLKAGESVFQTLY